MKLDEKKFGQACAITGAFLWVVCSLLIMILPGTMMEMSGDMVHMDSSGLSWEMGLSGFIIGLFVWTFTAGAVGWLVAAVYNKLV